jgi:hypothetical protein
MLGQILVAQGALSSGQLEAALVEQRRRAARGVQVRLGEILIELGMITPTQLSQALKEREKVPAR